MSELFQQVCTAVLGDAAPTQQHTDWWNKARLGELSWHWSVILFDSLVKGRVTIDTLVDDDSKWATFIESSINNDPEEKIYRGWILSQVKLIHLYSSDANKALDHLISIIQIGEHPPIVDPLEELSKLQAFIRSFVHPEPSSVHPDYRSAILRALTVQPLTRE